MHRHAIIGLGESLQEPVGDHGARALHRLLRRLAEHHQRAAPAVPGPRQERGRAGPGRHVRVVAAGVHRAGHRAGVGQAGLFLDRKRIQLGAQQHRRPLAVAEHAHHPRLADAGRHLVSQPAQLVGQAGGGLFLAQRQLGMPVQIEIESVELRIDRIERLQRGPRRQRDGA